MRKLILPIAIVVVLVCTTMIAGVLGFGGWYLYKNAKPRPGTPSNSTAPDDPRFAQPSTPSSPSRAPDDPRFPSSSGPASNAAQKIAPAPEDPRFTPEKTEEPKKQKAEEF